MAPASATVLSGLRAKCLRNLIKKAYSEDKEARADAEKTITEYRRPEESDFIMDLRHKAVICLRAQTLSNQHIERASAEAILGEKMEIILRHIASRFRPTRMDLQRFPPHLNRMKSALQSSPMGRYLTAGLVDDLAISSVPRDYNKNEYIIQQDGTNVLFVSIGQPARLRVREEDKETQVVHQRLLREMDVVLGEIALLFRTPRTASIIAEDRVTLWIIQIPENLLQAFETRK